MTLRSNGINRLAECTAFAAVLLFTACTGGQTENKTDTAAKKPDTTHVVQEVKNTPPKNYYGIDISQWNGNIAEDLPKVDSLTFMICKATEGIDFVDPDFYNNWKMVKEKGFIRGAYHFYHTDDDPLKQAEFFLSKVKDIDSTDMPLIIDIEQESLPQGAQVDMQKLQSDLLTFMQQLEAKSKRIPILYTDYAFANMYLVNDVFAKYPLWLAEYSGGSTPLIPQTWKNAGYMIWQKTDHYDVNMNAVDFDEFHGEKTSLTD
ncbi:MAG TPA: GH25 family lysozyme [Bacteroidia bacterium]|nr:GH25 family lysozyme [Bacteroidia bacterium]